ncbi:hypothetical protein [Gordonia oryzae]|nr:hypothetical protein [Gordonia oryzae]
MSAGDLTGPPPGTFDRILLGEVLSHPLDADLDAVHDRLWHSPLPP